MKDESPSLPTLEADDRGDRSLGRGGLLAAFAFAAAIYLVGVTSKWWPTPDSALYLGLGRSLASGQGYRFNGQVSAAVSPGMPLILAGVMRLFGENYWAANALMVFCGLGALVVLYLGLCRLVNPAWALAVVLCTAFSYGFYRYSHAILSDIPFALCYWAALYAALRLRRGGWGWLALAAALAAAGVTVRAPGLMALGALSVGLAVDRPGGLSRGRSLACGAAVFSAGAGTTAGLYLLARALASEPVLYAANVGRLAVSPSAMLHRTAELLLGLPETLAELFTSQEVLSPLGVILGALAAVGMVVQWRHGQRMLTVTVVLYVLGLLALGSRRPRYLLPVQPILLLLTVEGLFWTLRRFRRQAPVDWTAERRVLAGLVVVLVGCNAPRLLRDAAYYTYLSYTPRYYQVIRDGAHADLFEVGRALRLAGRADRPVLAGGEMVSLLHYVSGRRIVGLPRTTGQSPQEAENVLAAIASDRSADLLVIDRQDGGQQYRRRLVEGIEQAGQWRALSAARRLTRLAVYDRAPESAPAARQKDDGSGGSLPAPPESLVR